MRVKDTEKENQIITSAFKMIEEVGLSGVKMGDLAQKAGVATGTLYIYFSSKEDLIRKMYAHIFTKMALDLTKGLDVQLPLKEQIKKVCQNYTRCLVAYPEYKVFLDQYLRSPYYRSDDWVHLDMSALMEPMRELLVQGQRSQLIKGQTPDLMIHLMHGALEKYAKHLASHKKSWDAKEFEEVFNFIWDGCTLRQGC